MTDYEHLIYQQRGPVTVITINRPERMNAIGPQTHQELVDAWGRFRDDDTALVGVLTGAGDRAFCAGGDLKAAFGGELELDASPNDGVLGPSRWTDIYKPTIAAVNGCLLYTSDAAEGARSLLDAGGLEDNEMSEGVQRGLHAGANSFVEFGTHESAIGRFHSNLDERLASTR